MICPSCQKRETLIVNEKNEKDKSSVQRNRYCSCGYTFTTYETTKKINKKRASRADSNWKNWRFIIYANYRISGAMKAMPHIDSDKFDGVGLFKLKGKSFWAFGKGKNMKFKGVEKKKETINKILKTEHYWKTRNYFFKNKPIEDMKNKDKVRKEAQQFFKSVCTYITNKEYDQNFFIKYSPGTEIWNDSEFWKNIWLEVR